MTAAFLSEDWVAGLSGQPAPAGLYCTIQHIVVLDEGEVRYWVRLDGGTATSGTGDTTDADVTVTCDRDTALALHTGALNAQEAFRAGRMRLRGDVNALLGTGDAAGGQNRTEG